MKWFQQQAKVQTIHLRGKEGSKSKLKAFPIRHCFRQRPGEKRKARHKGLRETAAGSTVSDATEWISRGRRNNSTLGTTRAACSLDKAFVKRQRQRSDRMKWRRPCGQTILNLVLNRWMSKTQCLFLDLRKMGSFSHANGNSAEERELHDKPGGWSPCRMMSLTQQQETESDHEYNGEALTKAGTLFLHTWLENTERVN